MSFRLFILLSSLLLTGCSIVAKQQLAEREQLIEYGYQQQTLNLEGGGQLAYWQVGDKHKPTVLLVHGFGGDAVASWHQIMLSLSKDFNVIAPDLLWFGKSYSSTEPGLNAQTQAIITLLNELDVEEFDLVGISYGGFVSVDLMIADERVRKAALLASPGYLFSDAQLQQLSDRFDVSHPAEIFVPTNVDEMRRLLDGSFSDFPWYPNFIDEQIFQQYFAQYQVQKTALIDTLPSYRDLMLTQLDKTKLPQTMIIWGEDDKIFPLEVGIALSEQLNGPLLVLPDTAHSVSNEQPEIISAALKAFFK